MGNLVLKLELPNGSQSCQQHQAALPTLDVSHAEWRQQSTLLQHDANQKTIETLNVFSLVTSDDSWKFIIRGFQVLVGQFCHCQFLSGHLVRVTVKPLQWHKHAAYYSFAIFNALINQKLKIHVINSM